MSWRWLFSLLILFSFRCFSLDTPKTVVRDPILVGRAWGFNDGTVSYNEKYDKRGKWDAKFDRKGFTRLTGGSGIGMQIRRVVPSASEQGKADVLVESSGGTYVFETQDFGVSWKLVKSPEPGSVKNTASSKGASEAVDLNALNSAPSAPSNPHAHGGGIPMSSNGPMFKILFDLLLHSRPGVSELTFDNYHGLFLVDFIPKPEIQFSFEVSPTPRYYEFDYQLSKAWQLRLGRIWIPFDDLNPHNTFGGLINTTKMRDPLGAAFLPDIWTDLGVGFKWRPVDTQSLQTTVHFYVTNGFQTGGTDPTGQVTAYPNFAGTQNVDNNTDKAIGARGHFLLNQTFGFGASAYTCRYTDQGDESKRLLLIGLDASVRLTTGTSLKGGYTFQKVDLATGAGKSDFTRGGAYAEALQRIQKNYIVAGRFGVQQGDDRVTDVNDQTWATGRVGYETDIWQLYMIYAKDLNDTPGKTFKEFMGGRFVVTL